MNLIYYPKATFENPYIQRQVLTWQRIGLNPVAWPDLFRLDIFFKLLRNRKNNYSNINWLEDRIGYQKWPLIVDVAYIFFVVFVLKIVSKKIIWTRHNVMPHEKCSEAVYFFICWFLRVLCDSTIVHAARDDVQFDHVVAHPLYVDSPPKVCESSYDFVFIGAIKPYKDLDLLLEAWPRHKSLLVAGQCADKEYEKRIKEISDVRSLNIEFINKYLTENEIFEIMQKSASVVIPNSNRSMIASGVFFLAAAHGVSVFCRRSSFSIFLEENYSFVRVFDIENLNSISEARLTASASIERKRNIQVEVFSKNGAKQCEKDWRKTLGLIRYA